MENYVDGKIVNLGEVKINTSINDRLLVGKMNLKINQAQEKNALKIRNAMRNAHIVDQLKREKSEDQKTLSRLEKEYHLPKFNLVDEDSWSVRVQTLGVKLSNIVENIDITQTLDELEIRKEFIAKVAKLGKKEKFKLEKTSPEEIINFSNLLAKKIMNVDENAQATEEDSKSNN